jgi:hypothetical protein
VRTREGGENRPERVCANQRLAQEGVGLELLLSHNERLPRRREGRYLDL